MFLILTSLILNVFMLQSLQSECLPALVSASIETLVRYLLIIAAGSIGNDPDAMGIFTTTDSV